MATWYNLKQSEREAILRLPVNDPYRLRMLATMRPVSKPRKTPENSALLTRNLKDHAHSNTGAHIKSIGFTHTAFTVDRSVFAETKHAQPDLIPRKKQKSYAYHPSYGNGCTVDGERLLDKPREYKAGARTLELLRLRYIDNMPSSDW